MGDDGYPKYSGKCEPSERTDFLPFIRELAQASGEFIRGHFMRAEAEIKKDDTPVTVADRGAERLIRDMIQRRYPEHGIIGEEYGETRSDAQYCWVLDPIDGTKAFVAHTFLFGTLIALLRDGRPILGAIHHPMTRHLVVGDGRQAWLNDQAVSVRRCSRVEDAVLLTTSHWDVVAHRNGPAFEALSKRTKLYRTWGDCHGYFLVAVGGADVMVDPVLNPWDIMALVPVIEGAGGRITDWSGGDPVSGNSIIATGGPLHDEVVRRLGP